MGSDQWYTNRDLFEQITGMQGEFGELRSEMRETRHIISQYNGLREQLDEMKSEIADMQAKKHGKHSVFEGIRSWGGWIFALTTLIVLLSKFI